jgi:hypothetical protein
MAADANLDMTLLTCAADRFDPLSDAERKLLAALPTGLDANCGPNGLAWDAPENDPARADAWGYDRTVRAALLVWLCTDAKATEKIHYLGIGLTAARIDGIFDLSFVDVPFPLSFRACSWPQGMRLRGAAIPELRLPRCRIGPLPPDVESGRTAVMAARLRVQNGVFLTNDFQAEGEVRLFGADIGQLDCSGGSRFKNANGRALNAARAKIGGPVFLRDDFQAEGEVRLLGADIDGGLECGRGSRFKSANGPALNVELAKIGGPFLLRDDFQSEGEVRLLDADIGGLDCSGGSRFKNANGPALNAARAKIGGPVLLRDDFRVEGEVRLTGATVRGDVQIENGQPAVTDSAPMFNLYGARIDGALSTRG